MSKLPSILAQWVHSVVGIGGQWKTDDRNKPNAVEMEISVPRKPLRIVNLEALVLRDRKLPDLVAPGQPEAAFGLGLLVLDHQNTRPRPIWRRIQ